MTWLKGYAFEYVASEEDVVFDKYHANRFFSKWLFLILINKIIVLNKTLHRARLFLSAGIDQIITTNLNRVLYMIIVYCHKNIDLHKH